MTARDIYVCVRWIHCAAPESWAIIRVQRRSNLVAERQPFEMKKNFVITCKSWDKPLIVCCDMICSKKKNCFAKFEFVLQTSSPFLSCDKAKRIYVSREKLAFLCFCLEIYGLQKNLKIHRTVPGADKFLSPPRRNKLQRPNCNFRKTPKKNSEDCSSNQVSAVAMTSASDLKWRSFNCFF